MRRAPLVLVVALAGCGGGTVTTNVTTTAALEPIPSATAGQLAAEADTVAADLDRGDGCAARDHALQLRNNVITAINAHQIPGPYQETLLGRVQALEAQITCTPPAPVSADNGKKDKHKKHGRGHGDGEN
jgi:hypothetical protein